MNKDDFKHILIDHELDEFWTTVYSDVLTNTNVYVMTDNNTTQIETTLLKFLEGLDQIQNKIVPLLTDMLKGFAKENQIPIELINELNSRLKEEGFKEEIQITGDFSSNSDERVYKVGEQYDVFKDLRDIVSKATSEVFIVDAYTDESLYELYVDSISIKVPVKILTKKPTGKSISIGTMLKQKRPLEIKQNNSIHDRLIFVDDNCWILGTSIKDAAKNQPTVLMKINAHDDLYKLYHNYFDNGTTII